MPDDAAPHVPFRRRVALSVSLGLLAGVMAFHIAATRPIPRDLGQVLFAARAMFTGRDPYALVGPGLAWDWPCRLFYPLPAALVVSPLALLAAPIANGVFIAIGAGALAWALMAHGYDPLLGFFSATVYYAAEVAQWSPLLAAGLVVAPLSALWIAKPTIGAALFVARPGRWRWAIGGGLALAAGTFLVQPGWLAAWLGVLGTTCVPDTPYRSPIVVPGGALALLALLRWRRPEARLVAALACVPQTLLLYETVPLLLVPRTIRESAVLTTLSYLGVYWLVPHPLRSAAHRLELSGQMMVLCFYLPCTAMVLRRPNEGTVPAWLERRVIVWPRWLRGVPA